MVRQARERCESCVYRVVLRVNQSTAYLLDEDDFQCFLKTLEQKKSEKQFEVYGYCLMSNQRYKLLMSGEPLGKLLGLEKEKRLGILKKIKGSEGEAQRQIAPVTGISSNIVFKA